MPSKVAPLPTMPPRAPSEYSTFIDVVLDHVCCTTEVDDNSSAHKDLVLPATGGAQQNEYQQQQLRRPQVQPQHALSSQRDCPQSRSTGNLSQLHIEENKQHQQQQQHESYGPRQILRPELTILPHLRFHPLQAPATYSSSLHDFYDLFLADRAPHSFKHFHKSNGDENVKATLWKEVKTSNIHDSRGEMGRLKRTITFQTKISPGSSSNPLSQSEKASSSNSNNNNSTTIIPLEVAINQTLIKYSKTWILECEFSFDFQSAPTSSIISTGSVGVGKKLGSGLGQYLMSNVVKGTTVNVVVTLTECDESYGSAAAYGTRGAGGTMSGNASVASAPVASCHDGLLSCLSHPLLLPPDGLCSASVGRKGSKVDRKFSKSKSDSSRYLLNVEEPSQLGASLLSAIKAKNVVNDDEFDTPEKGPIAPADIPFAGNAPMVLPGISQTKKIKGQKGEANEHEDVLNCSSRGSLKLKQIPSFELSRAPSTVSMRRIILEKHQALGLNTSTSSDPLPRAASGAFTIPADAVPPPVTRSPPKGLSMRIEMELSSTYNSSQSTPSSTASTSLSSSFPRSASISTIDDKVRRGLKKRVARSWISWAESWCMRLWEEEGTEQQRRRSEKSAGNPTRRAGRNVRPSVRRIGETNGKGKKEKKDSSLSSKSGKSKALAPKNVWEPILTSGKKSARWMSSEQEGEIGVEVTCTIPATPGRSSPLPQVDRKQQSKKGRRLLKSLSDSVPS